MNADVPSCDVIEVSQFVTFWMTVTGVDHVTLVAILPDGPTTAHTFQRGDDYEMATWVGEAQRGGKNVYFQPNETFPKCSSKPGKKQMMAGLCRFGDVDPVDDFPIAEERDRLARLADHLGADPIYQPTLIIDSGNGIQPIWGTPREVLSPFIIARIEAETKAIETALGAGGTHNIDRLLRLPGTVNFPNAAKRAKGRGVGRARLIYSGDNIYTADQITGLPTHITTTVPAELIRLKPKPTGPTSPGKDADIAALAGELAKAGADAITKEEHLSDDLRQRLEAAIKTHQHLAGRWAGMVDDLTLAGLDTSRSALDMSVAAMLKGAKFSHLDTGLILCAFAHGKANGDPWTGNLRLRHVARCVLRSHDPQPGQAGLPPNFAVTKNGVFYLPPSDGSNKKPTAVWVSARIFVTAETQDETGNSWGLLLKWKDRDGHPHQWAMPRKLLHADGNVIAAELEDAGLSVGTGRAPHDLLKQFLAGITVDRRVRCVTRTGWHNVNNGYVYVLSETEAFGPNGNDVILQTERIATAACATEPRGTLAEWKDQVARYAVGNYRLGLSISAAFTGPLLEITAEPSGGLHLFGQSQIGKTVALASGASVWGKADTSGVIRTWRATANGLEGVAAQTTDALLALDEIGMANSNDVGDIIYQLGNETGKARAGRDGSARARRTWRLIYVSTGEFPVAVKMGERDHQVHAGHDVRLTNIPADAGAGMGVFRDLHSMKDGAALASHLRKATRSVYGTAARAFLEQLVEKRASDPSGLLASIDTRRQVFMDRMLPAGADGQVISVCRRLSLIAVAGEMATAFGILPWKKTEAFNAVAAGFAAWLEERGGTGPSEDRQAVRAVRRFLEQHGESRFGLLVPSGGGRQSGDDEIRDGRDVINRAGFRRETPDGWEFLIFPESWKQDVCKGLDPGRSAAALDQAGFLNKGEEKHWAKVHRVPGLSVGRFYTVRGSILAADGEPD